MMSLKSVVRDMCDIFENESMKDPIRRSYSAIDRCQYSKDNNLNDTSSNININKVTMEFKANTAKAYGDNETPKTTNQRNMTSNYDIVKKNIEKFNKTNATQPGSSTLTRNYKGNSVAFYRSMKRNNIAIVPKNNDLPKQENKKQVHKLDFKNFENIANLNQDRSLLESPKASSDCNERTLKATPTPQPVDNTEQAVYENVANNRKPAIKRMPVISPKPKYLNKIKPHPNMPAKSRQQLQEKIKIFNDLANARSKDNLKTEASPRNLNKFPHKIENNLRSSPTNDDSDQLYENAKLSLNNKKFFVSNKSVNGGERANVGNSGVPKDTRGRRCSLSSEESSGDENSDDESSESEMATGYDDFEHLNVTKITVERRYNVPDKNTDDSTYNIKRETYYDRNLNPRIEHITRHMQESDSRGSEERSQIKKSSRVINELLQTELAYFKGLLKVYEDYIVYFKKSQCICSPSMSKVFGNIDEIYRQQIEFYGELIECDGTADAVAEIFLKNEKLFNLYENYIINKHVSYKYLSGECSTAIKAREKELGNKLNLESYLLTPIQRLVRYPLLLKGLQEALRKEKGHSSKLADAIVFMDKLIEGTNIHAKIVQEIRESPIDFSCAGKFLMRDDFIVRNNGKKYKWTVILFEDIVVFTQKVENGTCVYRNSINVIDLYIRSIVEDQTSFQLQNFTEYRLKQDNKYVYDLEVSDPKIKHDWVKRIETLLWNQFAAQKQCKTL